MTAHVKDLLGELRAGLVQGTYLYGSHARGEQDEESDVDVLVVLGEIERYGVEVERTSALVSRLSLKYGVAISRVFVAQRDWMGGETPFLASARQEAIPV